MNKYLSILYHNAIKISTDWLGAFTFQKVLDALLYLKELESEPHVIILNME